MAMKLRAGLMCNRSICWHLLLSEDINAGQSSKFPVRGRISDEFTLCIPVFPYASDCRSGLSLCSCLESEAEKWHVVAHTVGRGSELLLFLVSSVQLLRDQHCGLPWGGKSGCLLKMASSLQLFQAQKKTASFSLN